MMLLKVPQVSNHQSTGIFGTAQMGTNLAWVHSNTDHLHKSELHVWEKQQEKNCFSFWSHFPWTATPTHIPADEWPKGIGIGGIRGLLPAALFIGVGGGAVAVAAPPGNICEGCILGYKKSGQPGSHIGHRPWEGHKSQIHEKLDD